MVEIKVAHETIKSVPRRPFSENRSQKKGSPADTKGVDGLTLRVIA